jgi:hypothetical protein
MHVITYTEICAQTSASRLFLAVAGVDKEVTLNLASGQIGKIIMSATAIENETKQLVAAQTGMEFQPGAPARITFVLPIPSTSITIDPYITLTGPVATLPPKPSPLSPSSLVLGPRTSTPIIPAPAPASYPGTYTPVSEFAPGSYPGTYPPIPASNSTMPSLDVLIKPNGTASSRNSSGQMTPTYPSFRISYPPQGTAYHTTKCTCISHMVRRSFVLQSGCISQEQN